MWLQTDTAMTEEQKQEYMTALMLSVVNYAEQGEHEFAHVCMSNYESKIHLGWPMADLNKIV
jgi:hypothetical protein